MPNCFTLTRKSEPEKGPVKFQVIDEEMCVYFKAHCDPVHWYCGWYDIVGFALALGQSFTDLKVRYSDNADLLAIVLWLDDNFTSNSWAEIGRGR